jgi:SAM-dependent methyltransferase
VSKPSYGFDAPYVPAFLCGWGAALVIVAIVLFAFAGWLFATIVLALGLFALLSGLGFVYTTRVGKFRVWEEVLRATPFTGTESVLDLGCGRGAVLVLAARRAPRGRVVGVDRWRSVDQSGNTADTARRNLVLAGVAAQTRLTTGDFRTLPFRDDSFDVVVSSLAIHNVREAADRQAVIAEAYRVLLPGGRMLVADFRCTDEYAATLEGLGASDVATRDLGWRYWYGGPWGATRLVSAGKPR